MYFYLWRDLTKKLCTESTWVNDLCVMPNDLVLSVEVLWIFRSPPLAWRLGIIGYLLEGPTKNQLHFMGSGFISITSYCINSILNYIKLYILYIYIHITNLWAIAAIAIPSWYSVRRSCFSRVLNQHAQPRLRTGWRGRCCQQSPALSAVSRFSSHLLKTRLTGTGCHWLWQPLVFLIQMHGICPVSSIVAGDISFFLVRITCLDEFSVFHQLSLVNFPSLARNPNFYW